MIIIKELYIETEMPYRVYIDNNMDKFPISLLQNKIKQSDKIFIITDDKVFSIYQEKLKSFTSKYNCKIYSFPNGESNKNYKTVEGIYEFLLKNNADRESILVAFGGGVVGDITGFVAATFMRGISYINIPTTLISQVDSCIGGKTGYDFLNVKNSIGCFYNPMYVFISTSFLKTLSKEQFFDGFGEIIKYGLINNRNILDFINKNYKQINVFEGDKLSFIVKECLKTKEKFVEQDLRDTGMRNILNFGHTIGHGIEVSSNYEVTHGRAVALGMLVELKLSEHKFGLSNDIYKSIEELYSKYNLPTKYKVDNYSMFLYAIRHDKKNDSDIRFVLLEEVEKCKIKVCITEKEIITAVKASIENKS